MSHNDSIEEPPEVTWNSQGKARWVGILSLVLRLGGSRGV